MAALLALAVVIAALVVAVILLEEDDDGDGGGGTIASAVQSTERDSDEESSSSSENDAALKRALDDVQPGGTIRLRKGTYESLHVAREEFSAPVRIVGTPDTTVGAIRVVDARNVVFEGFVVAPDTGDDAVVMVKDSQDISFEHLRFDGVSVDQGVRLKIDDDAARVRVVDSDFTKCESYCIQPGGTSIDIVDSAFHDLVESDAIRGGGSQVTVTDSTFARAFPGEAHAHHNDFIQIMGGDSWLIERNRFGARRFGAAQVFVNAGPGTDEGDLIEDVRIVSNLFTGEMGFALFIGGDTAGVEIVNNTILAGDLAGIRLSDSLSDRPEGERPLVANNIIAVRGGQLCARARTVANVFVDGAACNPSDASADVSFKDTGRPVSSLDLLLGTADPAFAPPTDLHGHPRGDSPDIGAVELQR